MPRRRLMWVPAACALAVVMVTAPTAGAATAQGSPTGAHCAIQLESAGTGDAGPQHCFDTFAESIAFATGGRVQLPAGETTVSEHALVKAGVAATATSKTSSTNVLGVEYQNHGYGGESTTLTGTGDCYSGDRFDFDSLGGWDNRISSAKTYSGCTGKHYQHNNRRGSVHTVYDSSSDFGGMDNRTSSIRFS